jgi:hypothetical protein
VGEFALGADGAHVEEFGGDGGVENEVTMEKSVGRFSNYPGDIPGDALTRLS